MAYAEIDIINLGLLQIGALPITVLNENSPNAIKANKIWQYIRDEVLQARDWKFAISRVALAQNATAPLYAYNYAYTMPSDFLRLKRWRNTESRGINPLAYPDGYWYQFIDHSGYPQPTVYDPPVYPPGNPYVIEALPDGTFCLLTDYDNTSQALYINYVKRETNPIRYSPTFITALSFRVAAALAIPITESQQKFQTMMGLYQGILKSAEAVNESLDFIPDETGSNSWSDAGR